MRARLFPLLLLLLVAASPRVEAERAKGDAAWERGDAAGALVHWSTALHEARAEEDTASELDLLLRLAAVNRRLGRLDAARDLIDRAEPLATADRGRIAAARGLVALDAGDLREALRLLAQAFEIFQEQASPSAAADAANNLGLARGASGDEAGAAKAFQAAATLFGTLSDARGQADALTNLGALQRRGGRLAAARATLEQAVALYRSAGDVAGEADALANLGRVLEDLGRDDLAEELWQAALSAARARKDVDRQAALLVNLGALAHTRGDLATAERHYRAAEEAWAKLGKPGDAASAALDRALLRPDPTAFATVLERARAAGDRRLEAMAALNLAALLRSSDPAAAAKHARTARDLADALELPDVRWRADHVGGLLELDRGRPKEGITRLKAAVEALEGSRRALGDAEGRAFVSSYEDVYQALVDALLSSGDHMGAFAYAQRLQLAMLPAPPAPDDARIDALAAEERALVDALSAELARAPQGEDAGRAEALRHQLDDVRVRFSRTIDELRATNPDLDVRIDPEDLEAIQRDLDPGVVVLQPVALDDRLVLLVFRRDRLSAFTVPVGREEVTRTVSRLARVLQAGMIQDPGLTTALADKLGGWLLAPAAEDLAGAEVLVVSATGPLRQLPFSLLRRDGRWLAEDVAVVGVTHVGSLRRRDATEARFTVSGDDLLLVGNPDGTLAAAEAEVRSIAARFPGAEVLMGSAGTRSAVLARAPGRATLHLATHGRIDPERPDRSHLVLAGADDEGRLSYREIPGLSPILSESRLVVLSACESGRPVEARESDADGEVIVSIDGLAAQFRRAGVETLVASLWKVDDAGTKALMDAFYDELAQGRDIAHALQAAQGRLMREPATAHPWYWAAFVVVGDWR